MGYAEVPGTAASDSWEQHQELSLQDNMEGTALDISPGALRWTVTPLHSHQGVNRREAGQPGTHHTDDSAEGELHASHPQGCLLSTAV